VIFPLNQSVLKSQEFADYPLDFFGGQKAYGEIYIPAENGYKGFTYSPFQVYYYAQLQKQLTAINAGKIDGAGAAEAVQQAVVTYAKQQGFTVK